MVSLRKKLVNRRNGFSVYTGSGTQKLESQSSEINNPTYMSIKTREA